MNGFTTILKVVICFIILMDLTKVLLSFVCWSFQVLSQIMKDEGIRSGKSQSLGMPWHPKVMFKDSQASKLGDALEGIPSFFYQLSIILLGVILLFITWYEFCLEHTVSYASLLCLLFSLSQSSSLDTPI